MINCSDIISANIGVDCVPAAKGFKADGVLVNYNDIDFDALDKEKSVVSALSLQSGKYGVKIKQRTPKKFNGSNTALAQNDYGNSVTNTVQFYVQGTTPDIVDNVLQPLANGGVVVAILETSDNQFRIYGLNGGLSLSALNENPNDDSGFGWIVGLTETSSEVAVFLDAGTYSTTKLLVDGLVRTS